MVVVSAVVIHWERLIAVNIISAHQDGAPED